MYYIHVSTSDSIKSIDTALLEKEFTRLAVGETDIKDAPIYGKSIKIL